MLLRLFFFVNDPKPRNDNPYSAWLEVGDLVFVELPLDYRADSSEMASAIVESTSNGKEYNCIHVAVISANDSDGIMITDATLKRGVACYPLDTFFSDFRLNDGSYPRFRVYRLKDTTGMTHFMANLQTFVGRAYDLAFLPDNEEMYCTELVRDSYVTADSQYVFSEAPMNFLSDDGTFPPYWVWLFAQIGRPIPQGLPGTNPNAMEQEPCLRSVLPLFPLGVD